MGWYLLGLLNRTGTRRTSTSMKSRKRREKKRSYQRFQRLRFSPSIILLFSRDSGPQCIRTCMDWITPAKLVWIYLKTPSKSNHYRIFLIGLNTSFQLLRETHLQPWTLERQNNSCLNNKSINKKVFITLLAKISKFHHKHPNLTSIISLRSIWSLILTLRSILVVSKEPTGQTSKKNSRKAQWQTNSNKVEILTPNSSEAASTSK